MAKYKGREVKIVAYPSEEYTVKIYHDGGEETVKLSHVTLNQKEAKSFFESEQKKLTDRKVQNETRISDDKKLEVESMKTAEEQRKDKEARDAEKAKLELKTKQEQQAKYGQSAPSVNPKAPVLVSPMAPRK